MRILTALLCGLIGLVFIAAVGLYLQYLSSKPLQQPQTVREKLIEIQRLVGADPDGVIGPETTRLVNEAVEAEEQELFNEYAKPYFDYEFYAQATSY